MNRYINPENLKKRLMDKTNFSSMEIEWLLEIGIKETDIIILSNLLKENNIPVFEVIKTLTGKIEREAI